MEHKDGMPVVRCVGRIFPVRADGPQPTAGAATLELLQRQHYELTFWRDGLGRINYRRFFDISDLVAVRVEDPIVFEATHAGILRLAAAGFIDGVRVDHIDGMLKPMEYLQRLRRRLDEVSPERRVVILVEKILGLGEMLPEDWEADGTTGYEYAGALAYLMAPREGVLEIRRTLAPTAGVPADFHVTARAGKRYAAKHMLAAELEHLTRRAVEILDFPDFGAVGDALVEISAHLRVYRTYGDERGLSATDRARIERAAEAARASRPERRGAIAAVAGMLLGERAECREFLMKWQQFTGPLTAKGVEDTALYRDTLFLPYNEVGSDPEPEGGADSALMAALTLRTRWTWSLNPGATHDTKRGEDARGRLAVLAMAAEHWLGLVTKWLKEPSAVPVAERLLVYQSLWALWPDARHNARETAERMALFLPKALREAKVHSTWYEPDTRAEAQVVEWTRRLLLDDAGAAFRQDMEALDRHLAQTVRGAEVLSVLLRALAPGVPDVYQGTEIEDHALVDPDNRRQPDFDGLAQRLESAQATWLAKQDVSKIMVYWRALQVRRWLLEGTWPLTMKEFSLRIGGDGRLISWRAAAGQREAEVACWIPRPGSGQTLNDVKKPTPHAGMEQLAGIPRRDPHDDLLPAAIVLYDANNAIMNLIP